MDEQVNRLADKAWSLFGETPADRRLLIGVAGVPGSGKTTFSIAIAAALNARHLADCRDSKLAASAVSISSSSSLEPASPAVHVPMDGFHYTRAQLSAMPDPERAHYRRGAEFTFDSLGFLRLVQAVRKPLRQGGGGGGGGGGGDGRGGGGGEGEESATIYAPSFDHAIKDPKENGIAILPTHRIVVFEGNYILHTRPPWCLAAALMDQKWFITVDMQVARARVISRAVATGISPDADAAAVRADENDWANGLDVLSGQVGGIDEFIISWEDDTWVRA